MELFFTPTVLVAVFVGGLLAYFVAALRHNANIARVRGDLEADNAVLMERINARDNAYSELRASYEHARGELDALTRELRAEAERRTKAEEKSQRVPELELELRNREAALGALQDTVAGYRAQLAELETRLTEERRLSEEKLALLNEAKENLSNAFQALSAEALRQNNQSFLELAQANLEKFQQGASKDLEARQTAIAELVKPLKESLEKVDGRIEELEKFRASDHGSLSEQIKSLMSAQGDLRQQTENLVRALRMPAVRGRWGEIQLRRVVEMAGMVEYCDFVEQETGRSDAGAIRPDLIVRLPNNKNIVIDAKTPLAAYLEALEATDDGARKACLANHARQIRNHLQKLGSKSYWASFSPTPEFAVLFLPGETFFSAALEQDPELIEYGVTQNVILATPTTLIALLKAVAYGWRQERLAESAQKISELGRLLHDRLFNVAKHLDKLRRNLQSTVDSYNKAVGSMETRVFATARNFKQLGASSSAEIEVLPFIESSPRALVSLIPGDEPSPAAAGGETEIYEEDDDPALEESF